MRRTIAVVVLSALAALSNRASADGIDVRLGAFQPRGDSNLFEDDASLYTRNGAELKDRDWLGAFGGIAYNAKVARNVELSFHLDASGRTIHTAYRDYVTESGRDIQQSLRLNVVPLGLSLRLVPTGRQVRFAPFVAAGADLVFYNYEEFGDFIDFASPDQPVFTDSFKSEGVTPGFHVATGVRFALTDDVRLVGEYRYQFAEDDMGDDFGGNRIDLTGSSVTLGINVRF